MMAIQPAIQNVSKFGTRNLGKLFRLSFLSLFLTFIIINAIVLSIESKSIEPALKDIGGRLLYTTQNIQKLSLDIIENDGLYVPTPKFFGGIGNYLWNIWDLFSNVYVCFLWITIFIKFYVWSPLSNESNKFVNLVLSICTFIILQAFFILILTSPLEGQSRLEMSYTPVKAFYDFGRALPKLLSPVQNIVDVYPETKNISETNQTVIIK